MKLIIAALYVVLLFFAYRAIAQSERIVMLKLSRAYDINKRRILVKQAKTKMVYMIIEIAAVIIAIITTIVLAQ